ncbi:MAG TPA: cyclase family protein [Trebonia sp.]|jgi:kynurenine formamidase|nr:cyclase family protein [Trebonia sp.]
MENFREIGRRVSNWGRWGDDDERGTLNLVTPDRLVAAAALIRTGKVFDLGIPFDRHGPQPGSNRFNPIRLMAETAAEEVSTGAIRWADDYVFMALQGASQWDALAHVYYDDHLYNGFAASYVTTHGAERNSIEKIAKGVTGRGVLLDIARLRDVQWLGAGEVVSPDELDAAAVRQGVTVAPGDIILIRTGWWKKFAVERDAGAWFDGEPGIGLAAIDWLHDHEAAAVAVDNWAVEVLPGEAPEEPMGVHMVLIRDMGMTLGEIFDFEELADDCSADGVYEFFFCAPPIKFTQAVGSPINPLAIK